MAKDETSMTSAETKVPVGKGEKSGTPSTAMQMWRPFENLRHEVDRMFDDFYTSLPFRPPFEAGRHRALRRPIWVRWAVL